MKEKKLHRMGRGDLVDIIYQYQCREQELEKEIADLKQQLKDRSLRIKNAGSIAEAALSVNRVFEAAQAAADQYLKELKEMSSKKTTDNDLKDTDLKKDEEFDNELQTIHVMIDHTDLGKESNL